MQEDVVISPITEVVATAVQQSGGKVLGGKVTFIPLLERCGTETTLQIARFPHPRLPSLRAQLTVPHLRFFISPARVRRVLTVLRAALPGEATISPDEVFVTQPSSSLIHHMSCLSSKSRACVSVLCYSVPAAIVCIDMVLFDWQYVQAKQRVRQTRQSGRPCRQRCRNGRGTASSLGRCACCSGAA